MTTQTDDFTMTAPGGAEVFVRRWMPDGAPKAVVVIAHGLSEHGARYDRFARTLTAHGYGVYASDHRGHGETARGRLGDAGPNGWEGTLADVYRVLERARGEHGNVPAFFIGHSMGSVLGQQFVASHGGELAGAVLIGVVTSFTGRTDLLEMARGVLTAENASQPSEVFGGMFAEMNAPFEQVTGFEWLSRDPAEVRKYIDDPLAGNPLTNATMLDFLSGWMAAQSDETMARVPSGVPILIVAGAQDSAGGMGATPRDLEAAYRKHGVRDVRALVYEGARHEVLNETNRDEVERDILTWLDGHV